MIPDVEITAAELASVCWLCPQPVSILRRDLASAVQGSRRDGCAVSDGSFERVDERAVELRRVASGHGGDTGALVLDPSAARCPGQLLEVRLVLLEVLGDRHVVQATHDSGARSSAVSAAPRSAHAGSTVPVKVAVTSTGPVELVAPSEDGRKRKNHSSPRMSTPISSVARTTAASRLPDVWNPNQASTPACR